MFEKENLNTVLHIQKNDVYSEKLLYTLYSPILKITSYLQSKHDFCIDGVNKPKSIFYQGYIWTTVLMVLLDCRYLKEKPTIFKPAIGFFSR